MPTYVNAINNAILRANLMTNKSFTGNPAAYGKADICVNKYCLYIYVYVCVTWER